MTEAEWLSSDDHARMVQFLSSAVSGRKVRLYLCAGCRLIWPLLYDECSREAVEVAGRFADGLTDDEARERAYYKAEIPTFGYDLTPSVWRQLYPDADYIPASVQRLLAMGTEADWVACTDPLTLIDHMHNASRASERKLRLITIAAARLLWDQIPEGEMRAAVEAAELFVEGLVSPEDLTRFRTRLYTYATDRSGSWLGTERYPVFALVFGTTCSSTLARTGNLGVTWSTGVRAVEARLTPLVRDIFGNPFRPAVFDPRWRTADVMGLARGIYDDRGFDRMPLLADALMDAGCDSDDILTHCRNQGPHTRGCWVVDLILGKE